MLKFSRREYLDLSSTDAVAASSFQHLVQQGDTLAVREFINRYDRFSKWLTPTLGYKLLCTAVLHRDPTMVALLLLLRPVLEIETKSKKNTSPLWTALIYCQAEIVRLLINAGADLHKRMGPNSVHDPECTVLHYLTVVSRHPQRERLIELMIERGANVNAVDSKGKTPLHYAATLNDSRIAAKLIGRGAKVDASDAQGNTPLLTACESFAKEELIKLLIRKGAYIFAQNHEGCNALHLIANSAFELPEVAEILLKEGVSLYEIDSAKEYTPLHYAVAKGKLELAKMFIKYRADVNGWERGPVLPLFLAAAQKSPMMIEFLITKGADVEYKTKRGKTALHVACKNVEEKNISVLLEYGADINALDDEGATPFSLIEYKNLSLANQVMVRMIAKRTVLNKPTNEIDLGIIKEYPVLQKFYDDCLKELDQMKQLKLFSDVSYFSMFSKSLLKLALLLRDRRFAFPQMIEKINSLFPIYSGDFNRALRRAESLCVDLYCTEDIISDSFSDELPYPVIREIMLRVLPSYVHV